MPPGGRSPQGEQAALREIVRGWHAPIEALVAAADESQILRNDIYDRPPLAALMRASSAAPPPLGVYSAEGGCT